MTLERWQAGSVQGGPALLKSLDAIPSTENYRLIFKKLSVGRMWSELPFTKSIGRMWVGSDLGVGVRQGGRASLGSGCFIGQTSPGMLAAVSNHHI